MLYLILQALFCSSLPHPTADRDYALYEVGEGCEVTHLVPGIDLLSDKFRADGRQLVAALRWVTEELARGRYNLFVRQFQWSITGELLTECTWYKFSWNIIKCWFFDVIESF